MKLNFIKISGNGNDFVALVDDGSLPDIVKRNPGETARIMCRRRFGVGADGLLIIGKVEGEKGEENLRDGVLSIRYFNSDGSEAFCGNGTRCGLAQAHVLGWLNYGDEAELITMAGRLKGRAVGEGRFSVDMPAPSPLYVKFPIIEGEKTGCIFVNTGVPHAVVRVGDVDSTDIVRLGPLLRSNPVFGEPGANVDFISFSEADDGTIEVNSRFFERGVEAETMASGTGSVASALAASLFRGLKSPVTIVTGGGNLKVDFQWTERTTLGDGIEKIPGGTMVGRVRDVVLEGDVSICFKGMFEL